MQVACAMHEVTNPSRITLYNTIDKKYSSIWRDIKIKILFFNCWIKKKTKKKSEKKREKEESANCQSLLDRVDITEEHLIENGGEVRHIFLFV